MTPSSTGQLRPYSYDPVGNRLSSLGAATWSYNASNHLTSISGSPGTSFTYDANGRVAQASTKAASCTARSSATTLRRVPHVCGVSKRGYTCNFSTNAPGHYCRAASRFLLLHST